jgi:hypothetical protein
MPLSFGPENQARGRKFVSDGNSRQKSVVVRPGLKNSGSSGD